MTTPNAEPTTGVSLNQVAARGNITIGPVTVQNITQMAQRPPLWVNVPGLPPRFLGRDALVDQLLRLLLGGAPSVAIHGLPGVGKSALTVVLAHHPDLLGHFSDGVLWASLGPTPDVMSALAAWGEALGVPVTGRPTPESRSQAVANAIGQQRLLLVIDDAWQLDPAQCLRCGGPNCAHLLTTRDLALAQSFAGDRQRAVELPALEEDLAFYLLQNLAPEACAADPEAAQQLARALGGLPLALELVGSCLAAPEHSRFPELGTAALDEMADPRRRLALASVRLGTVDGRPVTLRETIGLSLAPLPRPVVDAFYTLGAFAPRPVTFDVTAAEAVSQADEATLAPLIARSLVEQVGPKTLALHQTVADVAQAELPQGAAQRHRDHYLERIHRHREDWRLIEGLYPQVQRAWAWDQKAAAEQRRAFDFVSILGIYQERRGLWADKLAWAQQGLELARSRELPDKQASMLCNIGFVYNALGDKQQALEYYNQALPLYRQKGDKDGEAVTLSNIGGVYDALGDRQQALEYYNQALPLRRQVGDKAGEAVTLNNIGRVYDALGDQPQALEYYNQALPLFRQKGDKGGEATTLNNIGKVYSTLGDRQRALEYYNQALPLRHQVGDKVGEATTLNNIGAVYDNLGDKQQALEYYGEALPLMRQVGNKAGEATTLSNIGLVYSALGDKQQALEYYNQALPLRRQVGDKAGEAVTRYNLAVVYEASGDLAQAEAQLLQVVALDEATENPDLESHRAAVARIQTLGHESAGEDR